MTVDPLTRTVREQVALGRLLPLGGPDDAAWITEGTAVRSLRRACAGLVGVRLGDMAIVLAGGPAQDAGDASSGGASDAADLAGGSAGGSTDEVSGAAPVGALPHVPLRIEADFEATVDEPLPLVAERLRDALWGAAEDGLGLAVEAVDLRVTGLLEDETAPPDAAEGPEPEAETGPALVQATTEAVEAAVRAVPGVLQFTQRLAGLPGLRIRDTQAPGVPARRVQLQIATAPVHRPLTVARAVAAAATAAAGPGAPGPVMTAVVVTDVG